MIGPSARVTWPLPVRSSRKTRSLPILRRVPSRELDFELARHIDRELFARRSMPIRRRRAGPTVRAGGHARDVDRFRVGRDRELLDSRAAVGCCVHAYDFRRVPRRRPALPECPPAAEQQGRAAHRQEISSLHGIPFTPSLLNIATVAALGSSRSVVNLAGP